MDFDQQPQHGHKLRKQGFKKYNCSDKILNLLAMEIDGQPQQTSQEKRKVYSRQEGKPKQQSQETSEDILKIKISQSDLPCKVKEKQKIRIKQQIQFQQMQEDYLINNSSTAKIQQMQELQKQEIIKAQVLDELVKSREQTLRKKVNKDGSQPTNNNQNLQPQEQIQENKPLKSSFVTPPSNKKQLKNLRQASSMMLDQKGQDINREFQETNNQQENIIIKRKPNIKPQETLQEEPNVIKKLKEDPQVTIDKEQAINNNDIEIKSQPTDALPIVQACSGVLQQCSKIQLEDLNQTLLHNILNGDKFKEIANYMSHSFYGDQQINPKQLGAFFNTDTLQLKQSQSSNQPNIEAIEVLEIVNNLNQKIKIRVSSKPQSFSWKKIQEMQEIPDKGIQNNFNIIQDQIEPKNHDDFKKLIVNSFDYQSRDKNFEQGNFKQTYQSGYSPAALQKIQEEPQTQRKHFIRQKQSQANLNLKRTCGVSYVKSSESQQLNVNHIFKKLPPLVFQCSSACAKIEGYEQIFENLFNTILNGYQFQQKPNHFSTSPIVCSLLYDIEEETIRDYILNRQERLQITKGKIHTIRKLSDLWTIIQDSITVLIHLDYDDKTLVKGFEMNGTLELKQQLAKFISNSDLVIQIQYRKGLSGRKLFLKSVGLCDLYEKQNVPQGLDSALVDNQSQQQTNDQSQIKVPTPTKVGFKIQPSQRLIDLLKKQEGQTNLYTCSVRMELYVDEHLWRTSHPQVKNLLTGFIQFSELKLQTGYLVIMMNKRLKALDKGLPYLNQKISKTIYVIEASQIEQKEPNKVQWLDEFKQKTLSLCVEMKSKYFKQDHLTTLIQKEANPLLLQDVKPTVSNRGGANKELQYLEHPLYCISTRDSFAFDLITKVEYVNLKGRVVRRYLFNLLNYQRTEYFFDPNNCPNNYAPSFLNIFPDYRVGAVTYDDFFTHDELTNIESKVFETEILAFNNAYLPQTAQIQVGSTQGQVASIRRTKFFFGYRYMWTRCQLAEPQSMVAAGVRRDVSIQPYWIRDLVTEKLEDVGIIPKNFVNSVACNVYHDGKEGLAQHFDDAVRFRQPIFTVRVFSDCRLCFGSQFYGFCNGAFAVPLPRGCILVMEEESYAANGIKHCVRPCDMTGKSAAIILRQMHHQVTTEADLYDEIVDFPCQFSSLSIDENQVPYGEQKRLEAELLLEGK